MFPPPFFMSKETGKAIQESLWGSPESIRQARKRQQLYRETFETLLVMWNGINRELNSGGNTRINTGSSGPIAQLVAEGRSRLFEIFCKFDYGVDYSQKGLLENSLLTAGKQFHKVLAGKDPAARMLEGIFENYWDNFFRIIRKQEGVKKEMTYEELGLEYLSDSLANTFGTMISGIGDPSQGRKGQTENDLIRNAGSYFTTSFKPVGTTLEFAEALSIAEATSTVVAPKLARMIADILLSVPAAAREMVNSRESRMSLELKLFNRLALLWEELVQLEKDYRYLSPDPAPDPDMDSVTPDPVKPATMRIYAEVWKAKDPAAIRKQITEVFSKRFRGDFGKEGGLNHMKALEAIALRQTGTPAVNLKDTGIPDHASDVFIQKVCENCTAFFMGMSVFNKNDNDAFSEFLKYHYPDPAAAPDPVAESMNKIMGKMIERSALSLIPELQSLITLRISNNLDWDVQNVHEDVIEYCSRYIATDITYVYLQQFHFRNTAEILFLVEKLGEDIARNWHYDVLQQAYRDFSDYLNKEWEAYFGNAVDSQGKTAFSPKLLVSSVTLDEILNTRPESNLLLKNYPYAEDDPAPRENAGDFLKRVLTWFRSEIDRRLAPHIPLEGGFRSSLASVGVSREEIIADLLRNTGIHLLFEKMMKETGRWNDRLIEDLNNDFPMPDEVRKEVRQHLSYRFATFTSIQIDGWHTHNGTRALIQPEDLDYFGEEFILTIFPEIIDTWELPISYRMFVFFKNLMSSFLIGHDSLWNPRKHPLPVMDKRISEEKKKVQSMIREAVSGLLGAELPNQIEKVKPEIHIKDKYDSGRKYALDTFDGVFQLLERGLRDVVNRKNLDRGYDVMDDMI